MRCPRRSRQTYPVDEAASHEHVAGITQPTTSALQPGSGTTLEQASRPAATQEMHMSSDNEVDFILLLFYGTYLLSVISPLPLLFGGYGHCLHDM